MKRFFLLALLCMALLPAMAQHPNGSQGCSHHCGNCPHHRQQTGQQAQAPQAVSPTTKNGLPAEITKAFPAAKTVKKETKWTAVYDAQSKLLGYALYSLPASEGIKGYNGETPLMIALSPKQEILCVLLLENSETPQFIQMVVDAGLLHSWDGLSVKSARKKKVDTVSGATYSSRSIIQTLQAALGTL